MLRRQDTPKRTAEDDLDTLVEVLSGRGLPQRDVVARSLEHADAADRVTEAQSMILSAARLLTRIEVRGGAGSGKTLLACKQTRCGCGCGSR